MPKEEKMFMYPRIKCPFCKFFTTAPEKLGPHLVDKHAEHVLSGYVKIKKRKPIVREK